MKKKKSKIKNEFSDLKGLLREKTKQFWDEVFELSLCYLLSSHFMDEVINLTNGTIIHDLLIALQQHQNFAGFVKIAFPLLLFLTWRLIRYFLNLLISVCRKSQSELTSSIGFDSTKLRNAHFENPVIYGLVLAVVMYSSGFLPFW